MLVVQMKTKKHRTGRQRRRKKKRCTNPHSSLKTAMQNWEMKKSSGRKREHNERRRPFSRRRVEAPGCVRQVPRSARTRIQQKRQRARGGGKVKKWKRAIMRKKALNQDQTQRMILKTCSTYRTVERKVHLRLHLLLPKCLRQEDGLNQPIQAEKVACTQQDLGLQPVILPKDFPMMSSEYPTQTQKRKGTMNIVVSDEEDE